MNNDVVLAIFISSMRTAYIRKRIKYIDNLTNTSNHEESYVFDNDFYYNKSFEITETDKFSYLTNEEIEVLNLYYICGYSYSEISKFKNEKYETIRKRRNRAVYKIKKNRRESNEL